MNNQIEIAGEKAAFADVIMTKKAAYIKEAAERLEDLTEDLVSDIMREVSSFDGEEYDKLHAELVGEFNEYLKAALGRPFKRIKRVHLDQPILE